MPLLLPLNFSFVDKTKKKHCPKTNINESFLVGAIRYLNDFLINEKLFQQYKIRRYQTIQLQEESK